MFQQCTRSGFRRTQRGTRWSAARAHAWAARPSWKALFEYEAQAADGVQELLSELVIQLSPQSRDGYINYIIERCLPGALIPHLSRNHLAGYDMPMVFNQALQ